MFRIIWTRRTPSGSPTSPRNPRPRSKSPSAEKRSNQTIRAFKPVLTWLGFLRLFQVTAVSIPYAQSPYRKPLLVLNKPPVPVQV
jgi:hypothetical protein